MRFLVDSQLPPKLARYLKDRGHDAIHASDINYLAASDPLLWQVAVSERRILISKDADFVGVVLRTDSSGQLVWIRSGNVRTKHFLQSFASTYDDMIAALASGQTIVELR